MDKIFEKISSYNILNYLVPGVIVGLLLHKLGLIGLPSDELLVQVVYFYFVGLVASRLGSLALEPLLEFIGFLPEKNYAKFLEACDKDEKIDVLVEQANSYRTFLGGAVLILGSLMTNAIAESLSMTGFARTVVLVALGIFLFALSYRKQSQYVSSRIDNRTKDL